MKKYLIKGILAIVVGGFMASCANDNVDYVPLAQQRTKAYKEAFKELIGGDVDPNQNWGFEKVAIKLGESTAATRARANTRGGSEPNTAVWSDYGYSQELVTLKSKEEEIVTRWFQTHTIADAVTTDWNNYWVVQVHYNKGNHTAEQHEWKSYDEVNNRENWDTGTADVSPYGHMDQLYANTSSNGSSSDHIYNFNTSTGDYMLVVGSETKYGFGYEESWGEDEKHVYYKSFMAHIVDEANGIDGYYVGFDYQAYKYENVSYTNNNGETVSYPNNKKWAVEPDGVYDDRIIKIVPSTTKPNGGNSGGGGGGGGGGSTTITTTTTTVTETRTITGQTLLLQGRVFCEDLGTTTVTTSDIDFNDIVFDARIWENYQYTRTIVTVNGTTTSDTYTTPEVTGYEAEICVLAAGGTSEVKVGGTDGKSIKNLFTVADEYMINTVDENTEDLTAWDEDYRATFLNLYEPKTFTADITSLIEALPADAEGYRHVGLDIIPIEVTWKSVDSFDDEKYGTMQTVGELQADPGDAPQKICLPLGTVWPSERKSILGAYPYFAVWARAASAATNFTQEGKDDDYLYMYPANGLAELEDDYSTEEVTNTETDTQTTTTTTTIPNTDPGSGSGGGSSTPTNQPVETVLWTGYMDFGNSASGQNINVDTSSMTAGATLRIEGSCYYAPEFQLQIALVDDASGTWTYDIYRQGGRDVFTNNLLDITITADMISNLATHRANTFGIWALQCQIRKISVITTN